jgi:glycosyltransferase involved in cell wall biosynthesis
LINRVAIFSAGDTRLAGGLSNMTAAVIDAVDRQTDGVDLFMPNWVDGRGWGVQRVRHSQRDWICAQYLRSTNFGAALQIGFQLRKHLAKYDFVWCVVGSGIWTLALVFAQLSRSAAWIATPFEEEFRSRFSARTVLGRECLNLVSKAENIAERRALKQRHISHIFAISKATRSILIERHGLRPEKLDVLYPPIDEDTFYVGAEPSRSAPVCVSASRLDDKRKNVLDLIGIWPDVIARIPAAHLVLIGSFDPAGKVAQSVARSSVADSIQLTGHLERHDLARHLRKAHVFALPSHQEGLGIVVMEALACGVPVVAYKNGGTDELLSDQLSGQLIEPGDRRSFAMYLVSFLQTVDDEQRAARSSRFRKMCGSSVTFRRTIASAMDEASS